MKEEAEAARAEAVAARAAVAEARQAARDEREAFGREREAFERECKALRAAHEQEVQKLETELLEVERSWEEAAAEEAAEAVAEAEARAEAATQEAERMRRLLEAVPLKPVLPTLAAAHLHGGAGSCDEPTASTSDVMPP